MRQQLLSFVVYLYLASTGAAIGPPVKECIPPWANLVDGVVVGDCPYGKILPGEVTWSDELNESDPFINFLCVVWGFVPYLVPACCVLELVMRRGTREYMFCIWIGLSTLLNEAIFKNLVKEPRPIGSCSVKCGMPSGHSSQSIGILTLVFLEMVYRICPTQDFAAQVSSRCRDTFSLVPRSGLMSHSHFVRAMAIWIVALLPVPASRVFLRDHTVQQVMYGSAIGCLEAVAWYFFCQWVSSRYMDFVGTWQWPQGRCYLIWHDYGVPNYKQKDPLPTQSSKEMPNAPQVTGIGPQDLESEINQP